MEKKEMTLIYYHVPQDRDDPEVPNMFAIPISKQNIKLAHISQYFPLKGKYTFRFKFAHQGFIVWLDIADPSAKLPLFKDRVNIKATRLSWNQSKGNEPFSQPAKVNSQTKKQELNLFDHHEQKSTNAVSGQKEGQKGQNLLEGIAQMPAFTQHSPNDGLNFFEVPPSSANKKGDANLMGNFDDKHGDLI